MASSNPFATRFVRPGALAYEFPPGVDAAAIVQTLAEHGWRGEIVGPHGSGKSTLIAALLPAIRALGRAPHVVSLHEGERRLPADTWPPESSAPSLLIVDGYEQLSRWERRRVRRHGERPGKGLLVTSHESVGLPPVFATATSPTLAIRLASQLLAQKHDGTIAPEEVEARFAARGGDLRETWFDLYDLFEERSPRTDLRCEEEPNPSDSAHPA